MEQCRRRGPAALHQPADQTCHPEQGFATRDPFQDFADAVSELKRWSHGSSLAIVMLRRFADCSQMWPSDAVECYPRASILPHVSRNVAVRLKTNRPAEESTSTQKYPVRSNW